MNNLGPDYFARAATRAAVRVLICTALALALLATGCGRGKGRSGKPMVFVSIPPQAYFVKRVAGDLVEVEVLVPAGQDPHTYSPTAQQMVRLEHAAALFRIGVPFETALVNRIAAASPNLRVVDTNAGLAPEEALQEDEREHAAEPQAAQAGLDPHTWLSPRLVRGQAAVIAQTLEKIDPGHAELYAANLGQFQAELDELDKLIAQTLEPVRGGTFYVFHPAFGYFAKAYGLHQEAVEWEGKSPSPRRLTELVAQARAKGVRTIFIQPQLSQRPVRTVADAIGAQVSTLNDLSPDYMNNMLDIAHKIRDALLPPEFVLATRPVPRRRPASAAATQEAATATAPATQGGPP